MDTEPAFDEHDKDRATIGGLRHAGALTLSRTFKVLSVVTLLIGVAVAWANVARLDAGMAVSGIDKLAFVGGSLLTTLLTAGALAFFGFIIEIAVDCWEQLWHLRYGGTYGAEDEADAAD